MRMEVYSLMAVAVDIGPARRALLAAGAEQSGASKNIQVFRLFFPIEQRLYASIWGDFSLPYFHLDEGLPW
jgi:hypothetical protein